MWCRLVAASNELDCSLHKVINFRCTFHFYRTTACWRDICYSRLSARFCFTIRYFVETDERIEFVFSIEAVPSSYPTVCSVGIQVSPKHGCLLLYGTLSRNLDFCRCTSTAASVVSVVRPTTVVILSHWTSTFACNTIGHRADSCDLSLYVGIATPLGRTYARHDDYR